MEVSALTNKDDNVSKAFRTLVDGRLLLLTLEIIQAKETESEDDSPTKPSQDTSQPVKINAIIALKHDDTSQTKKSGCC